MGFRNSFSLPKYFNVLRGSASGNNWLSRGLDWTHINMAGTEPTALQQDDARKVFVSRVPRTFDSEALRVCLEKALGDGGAAQGGSDIIEKAEVIWDEEQDCNKGWGFSCSPSQRRARCSEAPSGEKHRCLLEVERPGTRTRPRRGASCGGGPILESTAGFHEGEGACAPSATATPEEQARKKREKKKKIKCFAFRKGKCKLGDACEYSHDFCPKALKKKKKAAASTSDEAAANDQKPCFNWMKKGKCRKGDKCPYLHLTAEEIARAPGKRQEA